MAAHHDRRHGSHAHHGTHPHPAHQAQAPSKKPFIQNTRNRRQALGSPIPITAGGLANFTSQPFPQVGLAARVLLHVRILCNCGATPQGAVIVPAYKGPWNFLRNVQLNLNLGATNIINASGFALAIRQMSARRSVNFAQSNGGVAGGLGLDPFFNVAYNGATTLAANQVFAVEFVLELPIAGNLGRNFALGLINLQSPEVQMTLQGTFGSLTDIFVSPSATMTITGGAITPYIEYFEIPPPSRHAALPPLVVHRLFEDQVPMTTPGLQNYTIPRQGKLLRLIQYLDNTTGGLIVTGAPQVGATTWKSPTSPGILNWSVVANITDNIYQEDYILRRFLQQEMYGSPGDAGSSNSSLTKNQNDSVPMLPQLLGGFIWEFWGAEGDPARGNFRDVFDAEALTTLQFQTTLDSGVTINSGAYAGYLREFWQPLAAGAAQGKMGA